MIMTIIFIITFYLSIVRMMSSLTNTPFNKFFESFTTNAVIFDILDLIIHYLSWGYQIYFWFNYLNII
jgi:hypothetical protein